MNEEITTPAAPAPVQGADTAIQASPADAPAQAVQGDVVAEAVETVAVEGAGDGGATPQPAQQQSGFGMFVPMLLIFAIFYFMMIRPQQRKEKERRKMIEELRAGARVVFAGGFLGTIIEAKEKTFKIEIAGDVIVEVARSAVQDVIKPEEPKAS